MRHERILVILIVTEVVLVILGIVIDWNMERSGIIRLSDVLLTALWFSVVLTTFVAWIGLLNLVAAARPLYLASWVGYFVLILFAGTVATTAISMVVQLLTALVSGTIVGLVYFSELRTKFRSLDDVLHGVRASAA